MVQKIKCIKFSNGPNPIWTDTNGALMVQINTLKIPKKIEMGGNQYRQWVDLLIAQQGMQMVYSMVGPHVYWGPGGGGEESVFLGL